MENNEKKELKVMPFMEKNVIDADSLDFGNFVDPLDYSDNPLTEFKRDLATKKEQESRVYKQYVDGKPAQLSEVHKKEYAIKIEQMKKAQAKQIAFRRKITKLAVYFGAGLFFGVNVFTIIQQSKYENKPIIKIVRELKSDANLIVTDNGKLISGDMTKEELLKYVQDHNVPLEKIRDQLAKSLAKDGIESEKINDRIEKGNPEVFNEENYKQR